MPEIFYYIALSMIEGIGSVNAKNLISYCGGVQEVFAKNKNQLEKIAGIGSVIASKISNHTIFEKAEAEMAFIEKYNIKAIPYTHKDFPRRLQHCHDAPLLLFQKGNVDLNHPKIISIVGTRKATHYGKLFVEQLLEALKSIDVMIVSGMAMGIDGQSHKMAIENNLPTVGVLGHPLNTIYPHSHKKLAIDLLKGKGALLSEYHSQSKMVPGNFPKRNRIIAGMSDATIVVESDIKGGSIITANIANSYNRDVFALPGRYKDKYSSGCNFLIKTHKAHIIENAKDLLYIMGWEIDRDKPKRVQKELMIDLSNDEHKIIDLLKEVDSLQTDQMLIQTKMTGSKLATVLLELELKGIIQSLPGNSFTLS